MLFSTILTTTFLAAIHLYSTFASPIVSNDGVADGQPLNLTHSLAKRDYIPEDQQCTHPSQWVSRRCRPTTSDRTWEDKCLVTFAHMHTINYMVSSCPADKMCSNVVTAEPNSKHTIECIDRPSGVTEVNPTRNQQTGVFRVGRALDGAGERIVPVPVLGHMSHASVSAFLEGTDGNYVVAANAAIVGSLRGTTTKACTYDVKNRDCVPTGQYDLDKGNILDFTFGLDAGQVVRFYYAINGTLS